MKCPVLKNQPDGWCIRENCKYYNVDTCECDYLKIIDAQHRERKKESSKPVKR